MSYMRDPQFGGLPDQQQAAPVTVQPEYDAAALAEHAPERVDDGGQSGAMPAGVAFQAAAAPAATISNGNNSTSSATREIVIRLPPRYKLTNEVIEEKLMCLVWDTVGRS